MDRRQRKTEEAISRALNQLLEEGRDINTISVRELTAAADITRSTFYLHYHDIPDLINSYLSEYLNNIASIIQKDYSQEPGKDRNLYLQLLKFMEDNHQRTSLVFSTRNYSSYSRFIEEGIVPYLEAKYHAYLPQADQKKLHTISVYTSRGTVGIILEWQKRSLKRLNSIQDTSRIISEPAGFRPFLDAALDPASLHGVIPLV